MAPNVLKRSTPAALLAVAVLHAAWADGQTGWHEGFEGPQPSWRDAGGSARYRIQQHRRVQGKAHTAAGCEQLTVLCDLGTYVHISHEVGRPLVIDEILATVWVTSDRPGLQIAAEVVLPRTVHPQTGRPLSALVHGSSYRNVGHWEQLRLGDVPRLLARQVRLLRTQFGPAVDGKEAYLGRILLNVYGGPGVTNVWIDDLDLAGFVSGQTGSAAAVVGDAVADHRTGTLAASRGTPQRVQLRRAVLMVDGRPLFPRIIRHQGEPLAFLKGLGFNGVWLDRPASPDLLREANRLGLWLVCPPPLLGQSDASEGPSAPAGRFGAEYDRVLAWDLGRGLSEEQLPSVERWAEQLRLADRRGQRPLICSAESGLRGFSRHVDLLLVERRPLGTSLDLADYGVWIRRQPWLALPGTPIWTTIQTEPSEALRRQLRALEPGREPPRSVTGEQIRLLVHTAVSSGSRGLLFESESSLTASDPHTHQRAMALELVNLELQLVEPWAAAGSLAGTAEGADPEVVGAVLQTDRARLVLPIWSGPGAQSVPGSWTGGSLSLVVPGVPESNVAYELVPGGLRPLGHKRVTGGTRVTLEEFGLSGQVLLAQDPLVVDSLTRRAAAIGPRAAEIGRHLAVRQLHVVEQVADQLARRTAAAAGSAGWLGSARKSLQSCDGYLAAGNHAAAWLHARRATRALQLFQRAYWEASTKGSASLVANPGAASFATLPWYGELRDRIAASRPGPNRLPGGGFEDLATLLGSGWRHFQHAVAGVQTSADLIPGAAHSGFSGLRLTARAEDPRKRPMIVETPPLWITTPALPVEAGELICIHGWVNVPAAITGSVDGLLIFDSFSGEALAERISGTTDWRQFTLYRVAPQSGRMTVTFALAGLGEVRLDDVKIQELRPIGTGAMTRRPGPGGLPR